MSGEPLEVRSLQPKNQSGGVPTAGQVLGITPGGLVDFIDQSSGVFFHPDSPKTSSFTAAINAGVYRLNMASAGADVTVDLPASPSNGDKVGFWVTTTSLVRALKIRFLTGSMVIDGTLVSGGIACRVSAFRGAYVSLVFESSTGWKSEVFTLGDLAGVNVTSAGTITLVPGQRYRVNTTATVTFNLHSEAANSVFRKSYLTSILKQGPLGQVIINGSLSMVWSPDPVNSSRLWDYQENDALFIRIVAGFFVITEQRAPKPRAALVHVPGSDYDPRIQPFSRPVQDFLFSDQKITGFLDTNPLAQPQNMRFSRNGGLLVLCHSTAPRVELYQVRGKTFEKITPAMPATAATFVNDVDISPLNDFLAYAPANDEPQYLAFDQHEAVGAWTNFPGATFGQWKSCRFSPNGQFFAAAAPGTVHVWRRDKTSIWVSIGTVAIGGADNTEMDWSPDSRFVAVSITGTTPKVRVIRVNKTTVADATSETGTPVIAAMEGIRFHPSGRYVILTGGSAGVFVGKFNRDTGAIDFTGMPSGSTMSTLRGGDLHPNGRQVGIVGTASPFAQMVRFIPEDEEMKDLIDGFPWNGLSLSANGDSGSECCRFHPSGRLFLAARDASPFLQCWESLDNVSQDNATAAAVAPPAYND